MLSLSHFLTVGAVLFSLSIAGIIINRKNIIILLMCIELMLLAVNGINAGIGFIARDLTNALVDKQEAGFYKILGIDKYF